MNRITANSDTLMRQAPMTADLYLREAIKSVEDAMGKGAAATYPQIVAAYMNACAMDFGAAVIARGLEAIADREDGQPFA